MVNGIIGKKLGMTQIFAADGTVTPVTVVKAGPCVVVQRKTAAGKDGYEAVQLGFVDDKAPKKVNKPMKGHFDKAGIPPTRILKEIRLQDGDDANVGDKILVDQFAENDVVEIIGTSKGRGFAGFIKRHGFGGGRDTHGSMFHRAPGSIGASAYPSRVIKGTRMAGHMGVERKTIKNLKVVRVNADENLLMIKGALPGPTGAYVLIKKVKK
ncbi:MAG TPA: 50S ribosomal protein L3 [Blastocatellia bacterium]|nr:50S ribosomal protein L3 [Blastocatellia bacterium]